MSERTQEEWESTILLWQASSFEPGSLAGEILSAISAAKRSVVENPLMREALKRAQGALIVASKGWTNPLIDKALIEWITDILNGGSTPAPYHEDDVRPHEFPMTTDELQEPKP